MTSTPKPPVRGFQIHTPSLRAKDHDTVKDYTGDFRIGEDGKQVPEHVLRSSVKLTPEILEVMRHQAKVWKAGDHENLLDFIQDQALMALQIGALMMTAEYSGTQANTQRLAAINTVIKEGKELVDMIRKVMSMTGKGTRGGRT